LGRPGRPGDAHRVSYDFRNSLDCGHFALGLDDILGRTDAFDCIGPKTASRLSGCNRRNDPFLVTGLRVVEGHLHEETVELGFWQRVGPILLDRVLGSDGHEWQIQRQRLAVDGYLSLLHHFEKRGLSFGRARLISSARRRLAKTGPLRIWNR